MSILGWVVIGILGANTLFFGVLALLHLIEERRNKR